MTFPRALTIATGIGMALLVACALFFHVSDADVWWHLKAGQVMLETGRLIAIDPFAHTREGMAYLATHEWLAQVALAGMYELGGAHALIVLRIVLALLTGAIVLAIDRKNLWPNAFLVAAALLTMRQDFVERPQLFSNVLFALSLVLCLRVLDLSRTQRTLFLSLLGATILWANLHGGAAILSPLLLGTVLVQQGVNMWQERRMHDRDDRRRLLVLLGWCVLLGLALLATPNLHHNITYLRLLATDRTAEFIAEWSPRAIDQYLLWIGPFWILALASLAAARRNVVAVGLLLLGMGILSRTGSRHEVLFVLTALACTFYELRWSEGWQRWIERMRSRPIAAGAATVLALLLLLWLNAPYRAFLLRRNLAGFGAFSPTTTAADFLDAHGLTGRIFNTYTAGGYLLFRGHAVFIDGRNVDYGYDFLKRTLDARYDRATFDILTKEFNATVAVIERRTEDGKEDDTFAFLPGHAQWVLVFLDDWAAIYLQRTPEFAGFIGQHSYRLLTTTMLDGGKLPEFPVEQLLLFEREVTRAVEEDPRGIRALVLRAKLHRSRGKFAEAITDAEEALRRAPYRYEPHDILGSVAAFQKRWIDAAHHYERAIALSEHLTITLPAAVLATVFEQAGDPSRAEEFRRKAAQAQ